MSAGGSFFYATNEGHSWQQFRNQRWLDWIESGVDPTDFDSSDGRSSSGLSGSSAAHPRRAVGGAPVADAGAPSKNDERRQ